MRALYRQRSCRFFSHVMPCAMATPMSARRMMMRIMTVRSGCSFQLPTNIVIGTAALT
jgi:hypothetical protein